MPCPPLAVAAVRATGIGSWPGTLRPRGRAHRARPARRRRGRGPAAPARDPGPRPGRRHHRAGRRDARRAPRRPPAERLAVRRPAGARRLAHGIVAPRGPRRARRGLRRLRGRRSRSRSPGRGPSRRRCGSTAASGSWPTRAPSPTSWRRSPTASAPTSPTCGGSCRRRGSCCSSTSRRCPPCSRARCPPRRASAGCAPSTRPSPCAASRRCSPPTTGTPSCTAATRRRRCRCCAPPAPGRSRSTSPPPRPRAGSRWRPRSTPAPACGPGACRPTAAGTDAGARALVLEGFERAGLAADALRGLVVSPACGLAALTPEGARSVLRTALDTARRLGEDVTS